MKLIKNILSLVIILITANSYSQELTWLERVKFNSVFNQNNSLISSNQGKKFYQAYVLSSDILKSTTNHGFIELTNFKAFDPTQLIDLEGGNSIPLETAYFNITLSLTYVNNFDQNATENGHSISFGRQNLNGNDSQYMIVSNGTTQVAENTIGAFSNTDKIKIERTGNLIFFKYNNTIIATIPAIADKDYKIAISTSTRSLSFSYNQEGFEFSPIGLECLSTNTSNKNWTSNCTYDIAGNLTGSGIGYYNDLGKVVQNQSLDFKTGNIWATDTQYDAFGRPAFNSASIRTISTDFNLDYKNHLIRKPNGGLYNFHEWETPTLPNPVGNLEGSLGWYYSNLNSDEPYQDATEYPFSRTVYDELNPGKVLKVYGGNKQHYTDINGIAKHDWKNGYSHSMPAAQELYYAFGTDNFPDTYNQSSAVLYTNQTTAGYKNITFKLIGYPTVGKGNFRCSFTPETGNYYVLTNTSSGKIAIEILNSGPEDTSGTYESNYVFFSGKYENVDDAITILHNNDGLPYILDTNKKIANHKVNKSIVIDIQGSENIIFSDLEGKTLASARAGGVDQYEVVSLIGKQGYVDIHLPKGCENTLQFLGTQSHYKIFDLIEGVELTDFSAFKAGVYRIQLKNYSSSYLINLTNIDKTTGVINPMFSKYWGVRYKVNYYDYSLNYYDKTGHLTKTIQPLGFDAHNFDLTVATPNHTMESTFEQNSLGQVLKTTSPDEGTTAFKYRKDGQIRFSQNSKQIGLVQFSYTNYDSKARPIESGVCTGDFAALNADTSVVNPANCSEQTTTLYDVADPNLSVLLIANGLNTYYGRQQFVAGNVVRTATKNPETSKTWYSYDIYGRVTWLIQDINGLGVKTIDYVYDDVTGQVTKVYYQKNNPSDRFVHRYTHNSVGEMVKVETSVDDVTFTEQAAYTYYEKGALKRTELAEGIQGIDYVYNLDGSLKSINHPSLDPAKDPGHDPNDAFGITLDYHQDDYLRSNTNISTSTAGENRFDGNIKATHWATKDLTIPGTTHSYYYTYNKNKWLEGADFKYDSTTATSSSSIADHENRNQVVTASEDVQAAIRVTLNEGFHAVATPTLTFKASIVPNAANTTDFDVTGITYDANGNILTLNRNKNTDAGSNTMDQFAYDYTDGKNQLNHVTDAVVNSSVTTDLETQALNNYEYNKIGQLTKNNEEGVLYQYNTAGLVTKVSNVAGTNSIDFVYNDKGQRIQKRSSVVNGLSVTTNTTHYVRDVSGNTLAVYTSNNFGGTPSPQEYPIYGASRVGVYHKQTNSESYQLTDHLGNVRAVITRDPIATSTPVVYQNNFATTVDPFIPVGIATTATLDGGQLKVGITGTDKGTQATFNLTANNTYKFEYDLQRSNDLAGSFTCEVSGTSGIIQTHPEAYPGNKAFFFTPIASGNYTFAFMLRNNTTTPAQHFTLDNIHITNVTTDVAAISNYTDYYPFGMPMPSRQVVDGTYRYAFQGQEKDGETGKEAFQLRLWDGRIGRWLTTDPYGQYSSPYLGMGNDPINGIDPDGGYRTWIGAAFGWIGGGFQGSIRNPGLGGNENYAVYKGSFQNDGQGTMGSFVYQNDFGSNSDYWANIFSSAYDLNSKFDLSYTIGATLISAKNASKMADVIRGAVLFSGGNISGLVLDGTEDLATLRQKLTGFGLKNVGLSGVSKTLNFTGNILIYGGIALNLGATYNKLNSPTATKNEKISAGIEGTLNTGLGLVSTKIPAIGIIVGASQVYYKSARGQAHIHRLNKQIKNDLDSGLMVHEMIAKHSCFIKGTKVLLSNGEEKNIEEIIVGDKILSVDINSMKIEEDKVIKIPSALKKYRIIEAKFENGTVNKFSPAHPYWVKNKGWCVYDLKEAETELEFGANKLNIGDTVMYYSNGKLMETSIVELNDTGDYVEMFNVEFVEKNHTFFANGILVHNKRVN